MRCLPLLLLTAALAAGQAPPPKPGLHLVDVSNGFDQYLGSYANPSVDPDGKWLYADNGNGSLVRWRLDALGAAPTVFATTPPHEPGYRCPVAAPSGGLVAAFQDFRGDGDTTARRVAVSFLNSDGKRIAGGLPLYYATGGSNAARSIAWHPAGELVAFYLTVGTDKPGLYVFKPGTKYWVQARGLVGGEGNTNGRVQWSTDGRTLSEYYQSELYLRGGSDYAAFRHFPVALRLHTWIDMDTLLLQTKRGLVTADVEGNEKQVIPGWPGAVDESGDNSLVAVQGGKLAFVRAVAAAQGTVSYALHYVPAGAAAGRDVFSFSAAPSLYGHVADPVWLAGKAAVLLSIP